MKRDAIVSDLKRVDALRDEEVDYSDIPELDAYFFWDALVTRPARQQTAVRAETDVGSRRLTDRLHVPLLSRSTITG